MIDSERLIVYTPGGGKDEKGCAQEHHHEKKLEAVRQQMPPEERGKKLRDWERALRCSFGWAKDGD